MPLAIVWTAQSDAALRRMRAGGATWDAIAGLLGVSRNSVLVRGVAAGHSGAGGQAAGATGATPGWAALVVPEAAREAAIDAHLEATIDVSDARLPLPPGDAVTWSAITAGTLLAGIAYPAWAIDAGEG